VSATIFAIALAAGAAVPVQDVPVPLRAGSKAAPVRLTCPLQQTTRIVISQPLVRLSVDPPAAVETLGITPEKNKPVAVFTIAPTQHPASGTIYLQLRDRAIVIAVKTAKEGVGAEIRLNLELQPPSTQAASTSVGTPRPVTPNAPASPATKPAVSPASGPPPTMAPPVGVASPTAPPVTIAAALPTPPPSLAPTTPTTIPAAPPTTLLKASPSPEAVGLDLMGLLAAKPVRIGRTEGLPGQKTMVLEDGLKGERYIWLRFVLKGGAKEHVEKVSAEWGLIDTFMAVQAENAKDLKFVVQLDREKLKKTKAAVSIHLAGGPTYKFSSLSSPTLKNFLGELF
jgi:hypothetical protein